MLKLNLGCGDVHLEGWVNIDMESEKADLKHDLGKPFHYGDNTVDFIYSEHFVEHLTVKEGLALFSECRRILSPGGVLRIATPNLDYLMFRYFFFWKWRKWYKKYGYEWIQTRAEMVNICFRDWGHKYLYNKQELERRLREVGFKKVYRQKFMKSKYAELTKKETRRESRLIMEAIK
jgi:predicted SAM-dependent methyltransferase